MSVNRAREQCLLQLDVREPEEGANVVDDVVLLHGWGIDSRVWQRLLPLLRPRCRVHLLDLPGFGRNMAFNDWGDEAALLAGLAAILPPQAHIVGWSLGGNIALAYARDYAERVLSLSLIACNPSFQSRDGWACGMDGDVLQGFVSLLTAQPDKAIQRFQLLQCRGDALGRRLAERLRNLPGSPLRYRAQTLADALGYLQRVDQRAYRNDGSPLYLLGAADALVPSELSQRLSRVTVLPNTAHLPMLSDPEGLSELLLSEIRNHSGAVLARHKRRIAQSFSEAASGYDRVAHLQREVGLELLSLMPKFLTPSGQERGMGLDLGCGTGFFLGRLRQSHPQLDWLGGDIAQGMLRFVRATDAAAGAALLGLDAESLPFADARLAGVYSNLAVQWCADLDSLFGELHRVLRPGGQVCFSTLVDGTLDELKNAWQSVDGCVHVNHFYTEDQWLEAIDRAGLRARVWRRETRVTHYRQVADLVRELKGLGAHNLNAGRPGGLTGKGSWRKLRTSYERYRQGMHGLPASWELVYGVLVHA